MLYFLSKVVVRTFYYLIFFHQMSINWILLGRTFSVWFGLFSSLFVLYATYQWWNTSVYTTSREIKTLRYILKFVWAASIVFTLACALIWARRRAAVIKKKNEDQNLGSADKD